MSRLTEQQLQAVKDKAAQFQNRLINQARAQVTQHGMEKGAFFNLLFHLAGELIEGDVDSFCALAETVFEEIEAYGQDPLLDADWLAEVTGEKDNFYFSTDNLVSDLVTLPKRKRRVKILSDEEQERLRREVENAIIDEPEPQNLEQALAVAHAEDPQLWILAIKRTLHTLGGKTDFYTLRLQANLSAGELFLGLLLGQQHWKLSQTSFYNAVFIEAIA